MNETKTLITEQNNYDETPQATKMQAGYIMTMKPMLKSNQNCTPLIFRGIQDEHDMNVYWEFKGSNHLLIVISPVL